MATLFERYSELKSERKKFNDFFQFNQLALGKTREVVLCFRKGRSIVFDKITEDYLTFLDFKNGVHYEKKNTDPRNSPTGLRLILNDKGVKRMGHITRPLLQAIEDQKELKESNDKKEFEIHEKVIIDFYKEGGKFPCSPQVMKSKKYMKENHSMGWRELESRYSK